MAGFSPYFIFCTVMPDFDYGDWVQLIDDNRVSNIKRFTMGAIGPITISATGISLDH